jgi:hypothetical protein
MFMPLWPLLGIGWLDQGGGWMALAVMEEAMAVWAYLIKAGARALVQQGISGWYALTLPLGAAVLGAMILVSTWKVVTRRGVTWKDRR